MKLFEHLRAQVLDVADTLDVFAHDSELIAAEARTERLAEQPVQTQAFAHCLQHAIAESMAEAVVDRLEVVEVDRQQREPRIVDFGAVDGGIQMHEQLAAVRQIGERVVIREMVQLARALIDLRLQLYLVGAHGALRVLQLFGHLVEGDGEHVELTNAGARHARAHGAAGKASSRVDQAAYGRGHARHGHDRDEEQQHQHRGARPDQLLIGFIRRAHRQAVGVGQCVARRLDQLRHDQRRDLRALVPEQHRAVVEVVDRFERGAPPGNDPGEIAGDFLQPRLAVHLRELGRMLLQVQLEGALGGNDALNRARRGHARRGADPLANRVEHAREVHQPLAGKHSAGDAHRAGMRRIHARLELVETCPVLAQARAARRAVAEHLLAHRAELCRARRRTPAPRPSAAENSWPLRRTR